MTTTAKPFNEALGRLNDAGFGKKFIRDYALPSWWVDDVAQTPAGLDQTLLIISRRLGLAFESLRTPGKALVGVAPDVRFKRIGDAPTETLRVPAAMGAKLARLVLRATPAGESRPLPSAADARAEILETGAGWVGLTELIDHSWAHGVPVIHMDALPKSTSGQSVRRPAGMAIRVGDRFAIVLCRREKSEAKQAFWLAHELGHIAHGHIETGVLVEDVNIDRQSEDPQEKEANDYAIWLMCGTDESRFRATGSKALSPKVVAEEAKRLGAELYILPGHIALSYAHNMTARHGKQFYAVANKALGLLRESDALHTMRTKLDDKMDWDSLSDDDDEFVRLLTLIDDDL